MRPGPDQFSLQGLGIGLTGGGGHLGREMALAIASAGGTAVIVGRSPEALEQTRVLVSEDDPPGEVVVCVGDVADPATFDRVMEDLRGRGLLLDGWVNNAYDGEATPLDGLDRDAVERTVHSALVDPMMVTALAGREMSSAGCGSIVNVASMYGLVAPRPDVYGGTPDLHSPPAYGAAKAGLVQFTRYAAAHWGKAGVRVNALTPGALPGAPARERAGFIEALEAQVPMGRVGEATEVGGPLVFLLSRASSYMTGQQVIVDGGWTIW